MRYGKPHSKAGRSKQNMFLTRAAWHRRRHAHHMHGRARLVCMHKIMRIIYMHARAYAYAKQTLVAHVRMETYGGVVWDIHHKK